MVFFDAGHTLLFTEPHANEVYAQAGRRYGLTVDGDEVEVAFHETFKARKLDGRPQDKAWWRDIVYGTFERFGKASDPEALFEDLYTHFTNPAAWQLLDGAIDLLGELQRRGYRTGLISNWDDRLPGLLDALALTPLLDPVVISYRVGVEKPHPRIFETALAEAGLEAGHALMVGDDFEADVLGAEAVGMQAAQILYDGRPVGQGRTLERLEDLLHLLPVRSLC